MSYTFNNWRKIGGINRSADHNIVRTPVSINNSLNVTDNIGTINSDTILYGNLNVLGNIDISGTVTFHTVEFSGNMICDNLEVHRVIICDSLDASVAITCGSLYVDVDISCTSLDASGAITCDSLNVSDYTTLDSDGSITCDSLYVGSIVLDTDGSITCDSLYVSSTVLDSDGSITCDSLYVDNDISCTSLDASGNITCDSLDVSGNITCDSLDVNGNITCDSLDVNGNITCDSLDVNGNFTCGSLDIDGTINTNYTSLPTFPNNAIGYHYIQSSYIVQNSITVPNTNITNFTFPKAGVYLLFIDVYIVTGVIITDQGLWNITTNTQTSSNISWSYNSYFNSSNYCSPGYYSTIINATTDNFSESIGIQLDVTLFTGGGWQISQATCLYRYVKIA